MWETKKLKISSILSNLCLVERFVEEICEENYITDNYFGNIMLAMEEAVRNSIVHGNREDVSKQVNITFERRRGEICFMVEDEGMGFDPSGMPDPLDSEVAGKGLCLMKMLSDGVEFNPQGNMITLRFTISSINQETTLTRISHLKTYFRKQKAFA